MQKKKNLIKSEGVLVSASKGFLKCFVWVAFDLALVLESSQ